eukprot:62750_1
MGNAITNPARLVEKKVFGVSREKSIFVNHPDPSATPAPTTMPNINIMIERENIKEEFERKRKQMDQARKEREEKMQQEHERQQREEKHRFEMQLKQQQLKSQMKLQQQQHQQDIQLKTTKISIFNQRKNELLSEKQRIITSELNEIQSALTAINSQICDEEKAISKFSIERNDYSNKIVVLIGNTGDGKSALGNRLTGDTSTFADVGPYKTSDCNDSCTQNLQKSKLDSLSIIDCPGWNDGSGNDRTHTNNLCAFLRGSRGINAFIVVRNATNCRFDANFKEKLQYLGYIFGDEFWKHLIVVLTHVDKGIVETQFLKSNKIKEMKNDVAKLCNGLNKDVAVFPIGLDNYDGKLELIVNAVPQIRFMCNNIKSPIDDLKIEKSGLVEKRNAIQQRIDLINNKIADIDTQINSL